jgi:hypothetical protein
MENSFDLRKFLVENKLTGNSKLLKENIYDFDKLMKAVDDYLPKDHPNYEDLQDEVEQALNNGEIDTSEFSHSPGAPAQAVASIASRLGI